MAEYGRLNEPKIEFFKGASLHAIQRVIERAARLAEANAKKVIAAGTLTDRRMGLTDAANAAMAAYTRSLRNRPSIRKVAPDTGGRPYHFAYTTVNKEEMAASTTEDRGRPDGKSNRKKQQPQPKTREAAHQLYTERDGPVDRDAEPVVDLPNTPPGRSAETGDEEAKEWAGSEVGRSCPEAGTTTAARMQAYIEDPAKLLGTMASFGTIGDTLADRLEFWDLLHEHEREKDARTQTRMILELPHEATAEQRHEIVRRFTEILREKGIPFWASIHVPTKDNDTRNYHAHVVCTERPARKIIDPETGKLTWDFAITERFRDKTRHYRTRHPFRQNRDPEMRERSFVKTMRERLAETVNEVMTAANSKVRYDPRSYKDMGLDATPMRDINRILHDKVARRSFKIMDAEWTREMINAELEAAEARRSESFLKLQDAQQRVREAALTARTSAAANARLPKHLRLPPSRRTSEKVAQAALRKLLETERDRQAAAFMDEATGNALQHIADATSPRSVAKKPFDPNTAPPKEDVAALHEAAVEELRLHALGRRGRAATLRVREKDLAGRWTGNLRTPVMPVSLSEPETEEQQRPNPVAPQTHQEEVHGTKPQANTFQTSRGRHDIQRTGSRERIRASMRSTVENLQSSGLTGQDFADAMKAFITEIIASRARATAGEGDGGSNTATTTSAVQGQGRPPFTSEEIDAVQVAATSGGFTIISAVPTTPSATLEPAPAEEANGVAASPSPYPLANDAPLDEEIDAEAEAKAKAKKRRRAVLAAQARARGRGR